MLWIYEFYKMQIMSNVERYTIRNKGKTYLLLKPTEKPKTITSIKSFSNLLLTNLLVTKHLVYQLYHLNHLYSS